MYQQNRTTENKCYKMLKTFNKIYMQNVMKATALNTYILQISWYIIELVSSGS